MKKKNVTSNSALESRDTQQKNIKQNFWPIIFVVLAWEHHDEKKEKLEIPNVVICRRYSSDKQNDMSALHANLPEIIKNVTYTNNPWQIVSQLKPDAKNIIFVGQYFDYNGTGTGIAKTIKETWLDTEVILLTSIDVPSYERGACDYYYKTSSQMNVPDGARMIVNHLKNVLWK